MQVYCFASIEPRVKSVSLTKRFVQLLQQEGVEEEQITVVSLVTCPEAADKFCQVQLRSDLVLPWTEIADSSK